MEEQNRESKANVLSLSKVGNTMNGFGKMENMFDVSGPNLGFPDVSSRLYTQLLK